MEFLSTLESSGFSTWLRESNSIWGYPMILTLHTVGLALLVGANTVLDLRLVDQQRIESGPWPLNSLVLGLVYLIGSARVRISPRCMFVSGTSAVGTM